jgi:hypothetical protein
MMVEQAMDAAFENGDSDEADAQMDVLEDLEDRAARVGEAADAVQVYESAAQHAVDSGDLDQASMDEHLADYAAEQEQDMEEDLKNIIALSKDLAQMSLWERMNPRPFAAVAGHTSPNDAVRAVSASVSMTRQAVRGRLESVLADSPGLTAVLEAASLISPLFGLAAGFYILRRGSTRAFSVRSEILLFSHLYWNCYYTTLAVVTFAMPKEPPLLAFARAQPAEYAVYQIEAATCYMAYVSVLARHVFVERTPYAAAQLAGALFVMTFSYAFITFPAVKADLPPTCGWPTFAAFAAIFVGMTTLIRTERKGKGE